MSRKPNAQQMLAVIRIAGVINGADSNGLHGCLGVLMSSGTDEAVRNDALVKLRSLSGLIARYCDDYAHAERCVSARCGRGA